MGLLSSRSSSLICYACWSKAIAPTTECINGVDPKTVRWIAKGAKPKADQWELNTSEQIQIAQEGRQIAQLGRSGGIVATKAGEDDKKTGHLCWPRRGDDDDDEREI